MILASIGGDLEDDTLSIGSLFGSSAFCMSFVLFLIIFLDKNQIVQIPIETGFLDILIYYFGCIGLFMVIGIFHVPYWAISIILFGLYAGFIILVLKNEKKYEKNGNEKESKTDQLKFETGSSDTVDEEELRVTI